MTGLPVGAILSDGSNSFTATATTPSVDVSAWALSKLTLLPPNDVNVALKATAIEKDAAGTTSTASTASKAVTVLPTAPTLVANAVSGVEGTSIALKIAAIVTKLTGDSNSLASLVVSGLPAGTLLTDGTNSFIATSAVTSVDVSAWTVSKLAITPVTSGNLTLSLKATDKDATDDSSSPAVLTQAVTVTPPAPTLAWSGSTGGVEGASIAVPLSTTLNGAAADGDSFASLVVKGLTAGSVLSDGTNSATATGSGTAIDVSHWTLSSLTVTPAYDANITLKVTGAEKDAGGDVGVAATASEVLTITPLAPALTAAAVSGVAGTAIALKIAAGVTKLAGDGNKLASLLVGGIPVGATLSDGTNSFTATAAVPSTDISAWTLSKLTLDAPTAGTVALSLAATEKDASGDLSATSSATETISVAAAAAVKSAVVKTAAVATGSTSTAPAGAALQVQAGTTVSLGGVVAAGTTVTMQGGVGTTLQLDDATSFAGTLAGFSSGDILDLRSIGFGAGPTLAYADTSSGILPSGILTVSDGTHAAAIHMLGRYTLASFTPSLDHGTINPGTAIGFHG